MLSIMCLLPFLRNSRISLKQTSRIEELNWSRRAHLLPLRCDFQLRLAHSCTDPRSPHLVPERRVLRACGGISARTELRGGDGSARDPGVRRAAKNLPANRASVPVNPLALLRRCATFLYTALNLHVKSRLQALLVSIYMLGGLPNPRNTDPFMNSLEYIQK